MKKRNCAPLDKIPGALEKTGFILENNVAKSFKKKGWSTIGGRYYSDDVDGRARELDLVAYRIFQSAELDVVCGVLISCKKTEDETWVFLARNKPRIDPNFDWNPVHYWTDVQPLQTFLNTDEWRASYIASGGDVYEKFFRAKLDIFAFQQVSSGSASVKNDKAIFDSISTLMKALDHEVEAAPARAKGKKRIYTFSLLTVVDAAMVVVDYSEENPSSSEIEMTTHFARYMVKKRELSSLINFVRSDALEKYIDELSKLVEINSQNMMLLFEKSYESIRWNSKVRSYFASKHAPNLLWRINACLAKSPGASERAKTLSYDYENGKLNILLDVYEEENIEKLNDDGELKKQVADYLLKNAKYNGEFVFDEDIPF